MAREFSNQFTNQAFTVGQQLAFSFKDKKLLLLLVKDLEGSFQCNSIINFINSCRILAADVTALKDGRECKPRKTKLGRLLSNSLIQFEKAENSSLNLTGKAKGYIFLIQTNY